MTDIVIPLNSKSCWANNELRFTLRSIEQFLTGYRNVYIVGEKPDWIRNVIHIPFLDKYDYPARNIMSKICRACEEQDLSDYFLFFNDDHFLLTKFHAPAFPYFYKGDLMQVKNLTRYQDTVDNTIKALIAENKPTKDFDTHTPILYRKKEFVDVMGMFNWKVPHALCIKSLYCNMLGVKPVFEDDGKFSRSKDEEQLRHWFNKYKVFSIDDGALTHLLKVKFQQLYPLKSKYEL